MRVEFQRKTLENEAAFSGLGVHTGGECAAVVRSHDKGIVFVHEGKTVAACPENVTDTTRSTTLGRVRTIEHLLSAMAGAGITDAEVTVDGPELPALDGSAAAFLQGLVQAGPRSLGNRAFSLFARVNLHDDSRRIGVSLGHGRWRYDFSRGGFSQSHEAELNPESYAAELAPARTFVFEDEIAALREAGLGMGGNAENVLLIGAGGYLTPSRFPDEAPRHKLLDCIGDLYLSGIPPWFLNVVAEGTGHKMNVEAAARLAEICEWED